MGGVIPLIYRPVAVTDMGFISSTSRHTGSTVGVFQLDELQSANPSIPCRPIILGLRDKVTNNLMLLIRLKFTILCVSGILYSILLSILDYPP